METFLAIIFGRQDRNGPSRFLPIFACRGGPGSAARCGGGPRGTQKLICFCSPEPFTKIFWKRKPRENLAKTWRKPCENRFVCHYYARCWCVYACRYRGVQVLVGTSTWRYPYSFGLGPGNIWFRIPGPAHFSNSDGKMICEAVL